MPTLRQGHAASWPTACVHETVTGGGRHRDTQRTLPGITSAKIGGFKSRAQVYLEEADKPPVGEGLNRRAEVTLHKVWRMDKATNRPSTDPEAISRFERKLKKLAAEQSARFLSYSAESGTWVFEVDHFSRRAGAALRPPWPLLLPRASPRELHARSHAWL